MKQLSKFIQSLGLVDPNKVSMSEFLIDMDIGCNSSYRWWASSMVIIISLIAIWDWKNVNHHRFGSFTRRREIDINTIQNLTLIIGAYVFTISLIKILCINKFNKIASMLLGFLMSFLGWYFIASIIFLVWPLN
tara:strand:- start:66 stop:467 length:402 start_codon:yes stop_codon:yes gene_type:complete